MEDRVDERRYINQVGGSTFNRLLYLLVGMVAGYLSWACNKNQHTLIRVIYSLIAYFFNYFYLVFYFLYYMILGNRCG